MINIPLSFGAMWVIMFAGIMTHVLAKVNSINHKSPPDILWTDILKKFIQKEWASYGMSVIFTCIIAYSFTYMKQFENTTNAEISAWAKWIPLAVLILYFVGVINQWIFYFILGRIQSKGKVDIDILKNEDNANKKDGE